MATLDQMIAAIGDKTADSTGMIRGWPKAKVVKAYEALPASAKPKAPKSTKAKPKAKPARSKTPHTKSEAPKKWWSDSKGESKGRSDMLKQGKSLGLDAGEMAGLSNVELLAAVSGDEPKAEKTVAVTPIMEEWTKSVSDEVTMEGMLENIRLAFLEGRSHYGNELITAAKEAC